MNKTGIFSFFVAFFLLCGGSAMAAEAVFYVVSGVPNGKTLTLENGETVRLASIQVPNLARDNTEQSEKLAQEARDALAQWALTKKVRLEPVLDGKDRHGRIVALVYNEAGDSAQAAQLRAGLAWVYSFADTRHLAAEFLEHEREAEAAKRGVWAEPDYAVLTEDNAIEHVNQFRLVRGTVEEVADRGDQIYVNFGSDWKTDLTVMVDRGNVRNFTDEWKEQLKGRTVRVRGWLTSRNGPMIEISHPEQMEIVP